MNKPLPTNPEQALAAIARGWGREATTAHPDCTCKIYVQPRDLDLGGYRVTPASRNTCSLHGQQR